MASTSNPRLARRRSGFHTFELVVGCVLLMMAMGLIAPMLAASSHVSARNERWRIAGEELSNQMERLVVLKEEDLANALQDLEISRPLKNRLDGFVLSGEVIRGDSSPCIRLEMTRIEEQSGPKITLLGWLEESGGNAK